MFWKTALFLMGLWLLGLVTRVTLGGWIHILPAVALVVVLYHFTAGHKRA
jgi:hypothetical protein